MNLRSKKMLAKKVLKVGKGRIVFVEDRLKDIKEALTKQDIRDLKEDGAILTKDVKGRKKNKSSKNVRRVGKIKIKVNRRKQDYVILTRKLRKHLKEVKKQGLVSSEDFKDIRKKIRNKKFKSKAYLKTYLKKTNENRNKEKKP